jgi:single-stranded-DNA-specific exonuclease
LLITTDCGITGYNEIEYAKSLGIDVIVTDHHQPPEKLPACLIIHAGLKNTDYPFPDLSGAGIVFKLVQAIIKTKINSKGLTQKQVNEWLAYEKWLLDLVAVATVADLMPLLGENRTLVKYGLIVLKKTGNIGMRMLLKQLNFNQNSNNEFNLNEYDIAFKIAPRINAAGRIDHSNNALELFLAQNKEKAVVAAEFLNNNNLERQRITDKIFKEAIKQIGKKDKTTPEVLFAYKESWILGVAGLVASKLLDIYHKPIVIMTKLDGKITASVRSISGFNFVDALKKMKDKFSKFGGHALACGFTLKDNNDLEFIKKKLNEQIKDKFQNQKLASIINIDMEIGLSKVNWKLFESITLMRPFGRSNPSPVFLTKKVTIMEIYLVGERQNHIKLQVAQAGIIKPCIGFKLGNEFDYLRVGDEIDIIYSIDVNEWNGSRELQLKIYDIKLAN